MTCRWWTMLAGLAVCVIAALPVVSVQAKNGGQTMILPSVISAPDSRAFLAAAPVDGKAWRLVFFGTDVATAALTVTAKTQADCACARIHHNFPAALYAQDTPLGIMHGFMGLDATLTARGFVGPVKVAIAIPGLDFAALLVTHFVLTAPMKASNVRQAGLVAAAVESMLFAQHWPVLYFWSARSVRAAATEAAFDASLARIFAAKAGTVQVVRTGTSGQSHQVNGIMYYDDPVSIGYEASATIKGKLSHRGVTLTCRVHIAWDNGAWRYAGLLCAPAVYTAWFPQH